MTVTIGTRAELLNRVLVQAPVTATCTPPANAVPTTASLNMMLQQAFGKVVATGFAFANVACNGSPQTINVGVTAGTVSFHHGSAVAEAFIFADFFDAFGNFLGSVSASAGPLIVKIAK